MKHQGLSIKDASPGIHTSAVTVTELNERDSAAALLRDFGITDFADTEPAELALVEIEPDHLRRQVARAAGHSRYEDLAMGGAA